MTAFSPVQKILATLLVLLVLALNAPPRAAGEKLDEYQVKAGFVVNFALLTEWPPDSQLDKEALSIAILGKVPSPIFVNTLKSLTFRGNKVTVRHIDTVEEAKNARLVFISASEKGRLPAILKELHRLNVLTVSDMNGFCEAGGMIGLLALQNRIGYEVNLAAARRSRFSISSQMLKLAKKIYNN